MNAKREKVELLQRIRDAQAEREQIRAGDFAGTEAQRAMRLQYLAHEIFVLRKLFYCEGKNEQH